MSIAPYDGDAPGDRDGVAVEVRRHRGSGGGERVVFAQFPEAGVRRRPGQRFVPEFMEKPHNHERKKDI